jgi:RsmE family RNA methyltransferase
LSGSPFKPPALPGVPDFNLCYTETVNIVLLQKSEIDAGALALTDDRVRHITDVLGKGLGDSFDAGLIDGAAGLAHIIAIDKTAKTEGALRFTFEAKSDGKPLYPLEMLVGFPRPIQLKRLFRDMAGLGVQALHLCGTDLGEKSYLDSKIVERGSARRLLEEGSAQAKSTHIPRLTIEASLDACLRTLTPYRGSTNTAPLLIAAENVAPKIALTHFLSEQRPAPSQPVLCAIGAERGWTDRERDLLTAKGFTLCSMGPRVFRTETACTVAATLILSAMGVLD